MPQAIRVLVRESVPRMSIIELQGKVVVPDDVAATIRQQQQEKEEQRQRLSKLNSSSERDDSYMRICDKPDDTTIATSTITDNDTIDRAGTKVAKTSELAWATPAPHGKDLVTGTVDAAEVSMGDVVFDTHDAQRCTLRMGTLHVRGKRRRHTRPMLIIKKLTARESSELHDTHAARAPSHVATSPPSLTSSDEALLHTDSLTTELFQDWLARNRHVLALNNVLSVSCAPNASNDETAGGATLAATESVAHSSDEEEGAPPARPRLVRKRLRGEDDKVMGEDADGVHFVDYELVGYVEEQISFDSKPMRVMT